MNDKTKRRLSDLEKRAKPTAFVVLDKGRYSFDGKELTPAEFEKLKQTFDVTLFRIVYDSKIGREVDRDGDTDPNDLTWD